MTSRAEAIIQKIPITDAMLAELNPPHHDTFDEVVAERLKHI